jgi:hypothetical protein
LGICKVGPQQSLEQKRTLSPDFRGYKAGWLYFVAVAGRETVRFWGAMTPYMRIHTTRLLANRWFSWVHG